MQAVALRRGDDRPGVVEKPRPTPDAGEVLVRALRVGVDGTDVAVLSGGHGGFPDSEDHLVLGHEAVAVVADANGTDLAAVADVHGGMDLIYEATGYARHAFDGVDALAPAGVLALLGIPEDWTFEVDGGRLHRDLVLQNKAVVGSVNAGFDHFRAAVETLDSLPTWFLEDFVTGVFPADDPAPAFDTDDDATIKTAVQFHDR